MQRGVDLLDGHLLRVMATVVEERSVSRAAARLHQTQPAVSGSLKRLREIFGDALLVRDGTAMVPTARAAGLASQARRALGELEALLVEPDEFVPAHAEQRFRIASPDYIAPSWIARLAQHVGVEAPHCRIELRALGPTFDFERALGDDELDLVIGNWPSPPEHLHISLLLEDELVCLMARDHPLVEEVFPVGPVFGGVFEEVFDSLFEISRGCSMSFDIGRRGNRDSFQDEEHLRDFGSIGGFEREGRRRG